VVAARRGPQAVTVVVVDDVAVVRARQTLTIAIGLVAGAARLLPAAGVVAALGPLIAVIGALVLTVLATIVAAS
jgi:hypothetical protein